MEPTLASPPLDLIHTRSEELAGLMPVMLGDVGRSTSAVLSDPCEPLAASTVCYDPNIADDTTFYLQTGSQHLFSMEVDPSYDVPEWSMSSNDIHGV
jgi:hypothetical protein